MGEVGGWLGVRVKGRVLRVRVEQNKKILYNAKIHFYILAQLWNTTCNIAVLLWCSN